MTKRAFFPQNADKILFAEDLVQYMMLYTADVEIFPHRIEDYRKFICNRFSDTTGEAIAFLYYTMKSDQGDLFLLMLDNSYVNRESYNRYAKLAFDTYLPEGFDASSFLYYCTDIASLAAYFCVNGVLEAPTLAIENIVSAFEECDMSTSRWETLNKIAGNFASMARDYQKELSDESSDSDDIV